VDARLAYNDDPEPEPPRKRQPQPARLQEEQTNTQPDRPPAGALAAAAPSPSGPESKPITGPAGPLSPVPAETHIEQGIANAKAGRSQQAIDDLSEAIKIDASNAKAYFNRGVVWTMLGEYDNAIGDFDTTIQLDPNYPRVNEHRALAVARKERRDEDSGVERKRRRDEDSGWIPEVGADERNRTDAERIRAASEKYYLNRAKKKSRP
jgi:tetratricopeptide (TPR) repeat protein